jgi:hypothetical protein
MTDKSNNKKNPEFDPKASKLTDEVLENAFKRAIINSKEYGMEFTMKQIEKLRSETILRREEVELDAIHKDNRDKLFKLLTQSPEDESERQFSDGWGVGFEEGREHAAKTWRRKGQDLMWLMSEFFGDLDEK